MFGKVVLAAGALAATVSTASAVTLTETFEFGTSAGPYADVKVFTGSEGSSLTVSARTVSEDGSTVTDVTSPGIGQFAVLGLGVRESTGDNTHTVDGAGKNDLLELSFGSDVKILSATFTFAGARYTENIANIINIGTAGFAFFADDDGDGSVAGDMLFDSQDFATNLAGTGTYDFGLNIFSSTFAFAAIYDQLFCAVFSSSGKCRFGTLFQDSFKLKSITVERAPVSAVPVPGALPLFLSALAMGGYVARRRAKKAA